VFSGCPAAVEPYLNGDVPAAARALERDGQHGLAHRMLARFHDEQGRTAIAARHFEQASEPAEAAERYRSLGQFEKAARLYEEIGEDERAGEMYRSAGKLLRAGEAYIRADAYESAVDCFRNAGDVPRWIEALSKRGDHLAAAQVAVEQGDRSLAIQCLSRVSATDPSYTQAALQLALAYRSEGHRDLAARKLEELRATRPADEVPAEALDRLATLYEELADYDRALSLLEELRQRDAAYPHVASRVEALRKAHSTRTTRPDTGPAGPAVPGFGEAFRYEIIEEIGRGGMGVVFRARDRRLGREVALKRLPDNIRNHPKAIELFLREARAAAALNHPNIVTLFDASQEGDTFYITMELLQGQPLQKILQDNGRLAPAAVAKLGGQVATGLQYAHEMGIVHRDIKTANIFFTKSKVVKIMDFGLAKMVEEVRRSSTVVGGTPFYMAPEQSAGDQVDHRADLYALGVTFFELLTGNVPFKEGDVAFHHRHTPPPDLRDAAPGTPDALVDLVAALLAKRPAERIRSAAEVVRRLAEIARS
jgi:serine/threonine-protein kinase